jgi:hypothetical protein
MFVMVLNRIPMTVRVLVTVRPQSLPEQPRANHSDQQAAQ